MVAPSAYDDELWGLVSEDAPPPPDHLVEFVHGLSARRALDLGCGDGRLTGELRAGQVVGADVSEVALERARGRLPAAELRALSPGEPLPHPDSDFDLVLCAETLEHVQDVQRLLSEVRRVLEPGGRFAVTTPAHSRLTGLDVLVRGFERRFDPFSPHLRFFTARSLARALDATGFDLVSLRRSEGTLLAIATR